MTEEDRGGCATHPLGCPDVAYDCCGSSCSECRVKAPCPLCCPRCVCILFAPETDGS